MSSVDLTPEGLVTLSNRYLELTYSLNKSPLEIICRSITVSLDHQMQITANPFTEGELGTGPAYLLGKNQLGFFLEMFQITLEDFFNAYISCQQHSFATKYRIGQICNELRNTGTIKEVLCLT